MGYLVLSRKWRPRDFSQVIGQDHVCLALKNALKSQRVGHAYLLTGTRGVGKTTLARVFSKALCCSNLDSLMNPCLQCVSCSSIENGNNPDVMEIDGASHNGVEHIRSVIDNVQYLPAKGKYKVYIIDEVHMLSVSAFNALLKTLEEPPEHVIFLMATTSPEKLLGTVLSRVQRLDFRQVSERMIFDHLKEVGQKEKITFESDHCLRQVAKLAKGSVRDAMSLLEQVLIFSPDNRITLESLQLGLGLVGLDLIENLSLAMVKGDTVQVSKLYQNALKESYDLKLFCLSLLDYFYQNVSPAESSPELADQDKLRQMIPETELIWIYEVLSKDLEWGLRSLDPEKTIEIILHKVSLRRKFFTTQAKEQLPPKEVGEEKKIEAPQENRSETPAPVVPVVKAAPAAATELGHWDSFLVFLQGKSRTLAANLEQGNIVQEINRHDSELRVNVGFPGSAQVFLDYLNEKMIFNKLRSYLAEYFAVDVEKIQLILSLVKESVEEGVFMSKFDLGERARQEDQKKKEGDLLQNSFILEAKKLFNSEIDKVFLKE